MQMSLEVGEQMGIFFSPAATEVAGNIVLLLILLIIAAKLFISRPAQDEIRSLFHKRIPDFILHSLNIDGLRK
ncbi:MAG TPA: hypothetical protein VFP60_04215 [Pseudolabrys sp.]|nr:hypothetical protein [Pseudolabrys sp.]